jgi:PAS domain S-box-containing protein
MNSLSMKASEGTRSMSPTSNDSRHFALTLRPPRLIATAAAAYALLIGVLTLLGYALDVRRLTDWNNDDISMFPNAAAGAALSGLALLVLTISNGRKHWRIVLRVIAGTVGLLGGLTLLEHLSGVNLGIDTLFFQRSWGQVAASAPMRMGPPASTSYVLIGTGLLLATRGTRARRLASALGLVVIAIASLSLIGYWFGAKLFFVAHLTGIAFQTSTALAAIGIGLIACLPEHGLAAMLRRDDPGGGIFRRLLFPIIAAPLVLGWLRVLGQEGGYYDTAFGTAALALLMILMLLGLLWWTAAGVSRHTQLVRAAEQGVRDSEARHRALFEVSVYGVLTIDELGIIQAANPAAERIFGHSSRDMIGRNVSILMPEPYQTQHDSYLHNYRRTGVRKIIGIGRELTGKRKDGSAFPIDLAVAEFWVSGKRYFKGIVNDITDRKRAEQERARLLDSERVARSEAEQASRVKDEFLATLSHELRTPLNAILGWSRLIDLHPDDVKTVTEGIQVITRNAKIQADLIANLLDMSRIISGKLRLEVQDVNLSEVVTAAIDAVRHSAEVKRIRIESILSLTFDAVRGDPGRLQQVMWNLLSNAVKFTPKDGRIQVVLAKKDSHAEIVVSDTGIGIKPEFLPHLFERFRQADATATRQHGGLGLGLAIVKNLVELHAGTVHAESRGEGQGSTFTVQLPLALMHAPTEMTQRTLETSHGSRVPVGDVDLRGVTVLAIDDQADARDLLSRVLEECHAEVVLASSSDEGLQALKVHRPHVVLCDIGMPGKDGYDFIREMHSQGHHIPALAVTAFARPEDRLRAVRAGYQGYISKPLEPAELVATVAVFAKGPVATKHSESAQSDLPTY